ncbi:MAG: site-specific DNA-methyltransferase [Planctomycetaceae bacterium]|nr:site-specific DNA-methyltransferase [Planctomycetaceae bacterium]
MPETFDLRSQDIAEDKRQEILRLFPEIRTEGGKIDLERLKLALGEVVDVGRERYGMNWPGKAECFKTIQAPSLGTLRPCPDESVNFGTTENLIIEGDNLEVLKLLQKSYLGKVKMIYIDPPYNTGNDFIYPDNYTESLQTYLEYTGQVDTEGKKFGTNTEADGRFHSKWLNMMYPRMYLARNLLRDDGVVCVSIDDTEFSNLRSVLTEVFGEDGFVSVVVIQSNKRGQTYKEIAKTHEYLVIYSRDPDISLFELEKADDSLPFRDSKGPFDLWELRNRNPKFGRHNRPNLFFPIYIAPPRTDECGYSLVSLTKTNEFCVQVFPRNSAGQDSCWRWSTDKIKGEDLTGPCAVVVAKQKRDGEWNVYEKSRKSTTKAKSLWTETEVISEQGTVELGELGLAPFFEHPKPVALVEKCVRVCTEGDDVILDFVAGSGTTAHAVLDLNRQPDSSRKFILVQLPETTGNKEYRTIADICKERVRRVIKRLNDDDVGKLDMNGGRKPDRGFRVFKLDQSNFTTWDAGIKHDAEALERQLEFHIEHIRDGRTDDDILYELLLKSGYPLTVPVEKQTLAGKTVYNVAEGLFIICLERELTLDLIRAIAERKPERVVLLDVGFAGNDQLKANAVQTFKTKGVTSFKTV